MPELPEVHTITTDLQNLIRGHIIDKVLIAQNYKTFPENKIFKATVTGKHVIDIKRIAKNIIWELEDKNYIRFHLAMTGRILLRKPQTKPKWTKVAIRLRDTATGVKDIVFTDMRMFGKVGLLKVSELKDLEKKYGPEITEEKLNAEKFLNILKTKRTNIKNALLDQSVVSGLGNIYATDALFLSGIHPLAKTSNITLPQARKLLEACRQVITEGIKNRGSTLPDKMYVDIFGKEGFHQNHFKIYMKTMCEKCGNKVSFEKINGRGTYFCDKCQRL